MSNFFYKNYSDKPTIISLAINTTLIMARPTAKPTKLMQLKQKYSCWAKNEVNKQVKSWA